MGLFKKIRKKIKKAVSKALGGSKKSSSGFNSALSWSRVGTTGFRRYTA